MVFQRHGPPPRWGSIVSFMAEPSQIDPPGNPGQFDYPSWLRRKGVARSVRVRTAPMECSDTRDPLIRAARFLRLKVVERTRGLLPSPDDAVAAGILLSAVDDLPFELREAFESTGTVHLLSTSGFHLATLASVAIWLTRAAPPLFRFFGVTALCLVVALGSGGGAAPMRALGTVALGLCAPLLNRRSEVTHTMSVVLLAAMVLDPWICHDPGAQLSYVTVAGLVLAGPTIQRIARLDDPWCPWWAMAVRRASAALAVSTVAHLSAAPIVAYHMFRFQPWAPLVNIPAAVLGEFVLLSGSATLILDSVPIVDECLRWVLCWATAATTQTVRAGSALPCADISISPPPAGWVIAWCATWLGVLARMRGTGGRNGG